MHRPFLKPLRRPTPVTTALVIMVVLLFVRLAWRDESDLPRGAWAETVQVVRVIDGDTFECGDGRRVRLLGVDAPELAHEDRPAEPWATESRHWLAQELEGQTVRLTGGTQRTDRYGRTLAWVYDAQADLINRRLLRAGMARLLDHFGLPADLEPELRAAAADARIRRVGIWTRSQSH